MPSDYRPKNKSTCPRRSNNYYLMTSAEDNTCILVVINNTEYRFINIHAKWVLYASDYAWWHNNNITWLKQT